MTSLTAALLSTACEPSFADRVSLVDRPMVLAVHAEPPEARPGELVNYQLIVATPQGSPSMPLADWAYCNAPKPLTDNGAVSADCQRNRQVTVIAAAVPSVAAPLPIEACQIFGPDQRTGGSARPRDPDLTGGYYQPLRVRWDPSAAQGVLTGFGLPRVLCNLGNAPVAIAKDYAARYRPNRNPTLLPLQATLGGVAIELDAVPSGATLQLRLEWPAESVETFPVYNRTTVALEDQREVLQVSWFATAGSFAAERTAAEGTSATPPDGEAASAQGSVNDWTAPSSAGPVFLWVVLRDNRGGSVSAGYTISIVSAAP